MRIIVDIDDTVAGFLKAVLDLYNPNYDHNLTIDDITAWDLLQFVKPECGNKIFTYFNRSNLYDFVEPIKGALEGVRKLREMGHEVLFVTAAFHPGKGAWLVKHGFIEDTWDLPDYAVIRDKSRVIADVIIDDRPETVENFPGIGILYHQPHNAYFDTTFRAMDWEEVVMLVEGLEQTVFAVPDTVSSPLGLGPDAPTVVNKNGGKQSKLDYSFHLVDPQPLFGLANILHTGAAKYGEWNWRKISIEENLNHALAHTYAWLAGDRTDDHLGHAFTRLMFAYSLEITPGHSDLMNPD